MKPKRQTRTERIQLVLTPDQKLAIEAAAAYSGLSVSAYTVSAALKAARGITTTHHVWPNAATRAG